jgi:hypothetical protein
MRALQAISMHSGVFVDRVPNVGVTGRFEMEAAIA